MNLTLLDWGIVVIVFAFIVVVVVSSKKLRSSVSDFLAAGRTGGRYLISLSQGTAALGAITVDGRPLQGRIVPISDKPECRIHVTMSPR